MSNINQNAIYAILADSVYWDVRKDNKDQSGAEDGSKSNWTPIPNGWELLEELRDEPSGFTARAFKNSNFS